MATKFVVILPDGMADEPVKALNGKTPLEVANTPNLDWLVQHGQAGRCHTVPAGMSASSDIACMSVLGYDPRQYHTGRAPLEAARQGIRLKPNQVAFRCNLVTVSDGKMSDYSAGHITTDEADQIIHSLNDTFATTQRRFYTGVSYRHILVIENGHAAKVACAPPHDIAGEPVDRHWPRGQNAQVFKQLMEASVEVLRDHPVNQARRAAGKAPATTIWLWGQGTATNLPSFQSRFGVTGGMITAVDLLKGLAVLMGLDLIEVPGATGYLDTDYAAKARYALEALTTRDFMFVHVEATDEAGHIGDVQAKIQAIESVDKRVIGPILEGLKSFGRYRVLVLPDHPTSVERRCHITAPVPFVLYDPSQPSNGIAAFTESAMAASSLVIEHGHTLMGQLLGRSS